MLLGHGSHHSQAGAEAALSNGTRLPLAALRMMPGMMLPTSQVGHSTHTDRAGNHVICCHACFMTVMLSAIGQQAAGVTQL